LYASRAAQYRPPLLTDLAESGAHLPHRITSTPSQLLTFYLPAAPPSLSCSDPWLLQSSCRRRQKTFRERCLARPASFWTWTASRPRPQRLGSVPLGDVCFSVPRADSTTADVRPCPQQRLVTRSRLASFDGQRGRRFQGASPNRKQSSFCFWKRKVRVRSRLRQRK
jgi:hypothetical protein